MQLYSVKFRHSKATTIDLGEVVVMASNNEQASDQVAMRLGLPRSSTAFEVARLKPNMFQVMRREISRDREMPANGTFPRSQVELDRMGQEREQYVVQITASAWAYCEDDAVKKVARAALADAEGREVTAKGVEDLVVFADKQQITPASTSFENNSIFTHMKMFAGGAARPR
jgi:hypothetical protein